VEENIDSTDTNPFRYCGEYYDSEINQIYLRARYYSPNLGRFTQSDPAMADGYNWYVYCGNNPTMYFDPSGEGKVSGTLTVIAGGLGVAASITTGTIFGVPASIVLGVAAGVTTIAAGVADFFGAP